MVENTQAALHALHHVLVALRTRAGVLGEKSPLYDIIDTLEAMPLLIADPVRDNTTYFLETLEFLAKEYPDCRYASAVARGDG